MRNTNTLRRLMAAALAIIMTMTLTVSAFAAEPENTDTGPDLEAIANLYADWDGSYELPDLSELSPEDQETVKAMVDAIMLTREEETQAQAKAQTEDTGLTGDETPAVTSFSDVPTSHGFYTAIMNCASKGITSGYADGTFRPTNPVTRAQFCVMLSRAFYPNEVKKYDTEANKAQGWFVPNTKALSAAGVLGNTSFQYMCNDPGTMDRIITRYDMAQLMTNIMAKKGFSATTAQKNEAQKKIGDYKSVPSKYQNAVKNVFALGIINGYDKNGTFAGDKNMNRGQGCVVIYRMMQYTPATGTKPSTGDTTYDDGKTETKPETKPSTGTSTGSNTGNTGTNTGSNTGSNTGNTGTTSQNGVLTNGKPITEDNVLAMIQELLKKYPEGTKWASGTYREGWASSTMNQIAASYTRAGTGGSTTNMNSGCGGLTSLFSDSIFGSGNANPARKVPNNTARPGDVIITLNAEGKLLHVSLATTGITGYDIYTTNSFPAVTELNGGGTNGKIYLAPHTGLPSTPHGTSGYYEIWTRYPTNGTPWAGSSSSSSSGTSSNNTGASNGTPASSDINYVTTNNACGICGKIGGQQVRSNDGARYVCKDCYNDPSGLGKWFIA